MLLWHCELSAHVCVCVHKNVERTHREYMSEAPPRHSQRAWIDKIVCANFIYGISLNAHTHAHLGNLRANKSLSETRWHNIFPPRAFHRVYGCRCLYTIAVPRAVNVRARARVYFIICRIGYEISFWQIPTQCVRSMGGIIFDANIRCSSLLQQPPSPSTSHAQLCSLFVSIFLNLLLLRVFIYLVSGARLVWMCCAVRISPLLHNSIHYSSL